MRQPEIIAIQSIIADGLNEVKNLKCRMAKAGMYEDSAKLRDIEKSLNQIESDLGTGLFPVLTQPISEGTEDYFNRVFLQGYLQDWRNISTPFNYALQHRKKQLNKLFDFSDEYKERLSALSWEFRDAMKKLFEVLELKEAFRRIQPFSDFMECSANTVIKINFYGDNHVLTLLDPNLAHKKPFYTFEITLSSFKRVFYDPYRHTYSEPEPLKLFLRPDEYEPPFKFSLSKLLLMVASTGYLAWQDIVAADHINVNIEFVYKMKT